MHFFSRTNSSGSKSSSRFRRNKRSRDDASGTDTDTLENTANPQNEPTPILQQQNDTTPATPVPQNNLAPGQTTLNREPSVTIATEPVVNRQDFPNDNTTTGAQDQPTSTPHAAATARQRRNSASTGGVASDSGYGSPGSNLGPRRAKSLSNKTGATPAAAVGGIGAGETDQEDMKPIPVVWSGDEDEGLGQEQDRFQTTGGIQRSQSRARAQSPWLARSGSGAGGGDKDNFGRRANSVRSFRAGSRVGDRDQDSVYTGSGRRTPHRRISIGGGTFAAGPGTVGPHSVAEIDESFEKRGAAAEAGLGKKQMNKLGKTEAREGRRIAAVIKAESKAEQRALEIATKELADVQKMQKIAIKEEARAASSHARSLRIFRKEELEFFAARAKYERAQADLQSQEDIREASRDHAQEATELLQDKNREVEWLRAQKAADDRERELKLMKLAGKSM